MSAFTDRHYFSEIGESKSLHFWKDQLFSANSDIFQSRQNGNGSLYKQAYPSPFLIQRPKQPLKDKLCTEYLSQSLPQFLEYKKNLILESFFGLLLSTLCGQAVKLYIHRADGCWSAADDYFSNDGSCLFFKKISLSDDVSFVVVKCWSFSSEGVK